MTIRVRCDGCSAVMKVKDELAGAKGKCPKCKTPFVVPSPETSEPPTSAELKSAESKADPNAVPAAATAKQKSPAAPKAETKPAEGSAAAPMEEPIDQPLELTPPVPLADVDDFDPMSALASGSSMSIPAVSGTPVSEPVNKPSVAELMKEHEEKKSRLGKRKDKAKTSKAADLAQPEMTAGTAADALNRKYDQKRDESSADVPVMTRDERRKAEMREAQIEFLKKGIPALAGVLLLSISLIWWAFSESLPPLGYASGNVTMNGAPLEGVEVTFLPTAKPGESPLENARPSTGFTDSSGFYTLMYDDDDEGVLPGNHTVNILTSTGITFTVPSDQATKTVEVGENHTFDFNF